MYFVQVCRKSTRSYEKIILTLRILEQALFATDRFKSIFHEACVVTTRIPKRDVSFECYKTRLHYTLHVPLEYRSMSERTRLGLYKLKRRRIDYNACPPFGRCRKSVSCVYVTKTRSRSSYSAAAARPRAVGRK